MGVHLNYLLGIVPSTLNPQKFGGVFGVRWSTRVVVVNLCVGLLGRLNLSACVFDHPGFRRCKVGLVSNGSCAQKLLTPEALQNGSSVIAVEEPQHPGPLIPLASQIPTQVQELWMLHTATPLREAFYVLLDTQDFERNARCFSSATDLPDLNRPSTGLSPSPML